jgi:hypothetical protein
MRTINKRHAILAAALIVATIAVITLSQLASAGAPPGQEAVGQAMTGLIERGVPVKSWQLDGATLSVALQSESTTAVGMPDDPINLSLIEREAFLAKSRGIDLSELKVEVTNAAGRSLFGGTFVLDQVLDTVWSADKAMPEAETLEAVNAGLAEKTSLVGLNVKQFKLNSDAGARELHIVATAADVAAANRSTATLMTGLYVLLGNLNDGKQTQIALARVDITDESGQPLLKWIYDVQRGAQNWWQAPGMTTDAATVK